MIAGPATFRGEDLSQELALNHRRLFKAGR